MIKTTLFIIIFGSSPVFAQQTPKTAATTETRESDKLDIKKLEQKYWSAKDDDFSVVQNRRYVKAERFYLNAKVGIPFNDPYSTGTLYGADLGYFFSERWGTELSYTAGNLKDNDAVSQFVKSYGAIPDHNIFKSSLFASVLYVPLYAKMSFLDTSIIYFDMGISAGVGTYNYAIAQKEGDDNRAAIGARLSIFQQIFFSEHFAVRADLINSWSNQQQMKYYAPGTVVNGTPVTGDRDQGMKMINDTSLLFGLTYWF